MEPKIAILTGGAGDLGRGISKALTAAGHTVIALDLDVSRAESAARTIKCDVTEPAACAAAVDEVVRDFGGVDTLVNLAQQWSKLALVEVTDAEMRLVFESGPMASLRMMQLCYPHMKARGGGSVINFGSSAGTMGGVKGEGAYAAAKEAIRGLTKHAAVEWGPDNIRVNVICPVATDNPSRWPPTAVTRIPVGRLGDPESDVGSLVVYLAGPGSFMTGRTLHIDGGVGTFR
jgi:NAD(P)-dependent dehydrogenase (short-subunit alcohol dehydrogenase family)